MAAIKEPFIATVVNVRQNLYELRLHRRGETHLMPRRVITRRRKEPKAIAVLARRRSASGPPKWMQESARRICEALPTSHEHAVALMVDPETFIIRDRERRKRDGFDLTKEIALFARVIYCSMCGAQGVLDWEVPEEIYRKLRSAHVVCGRCKRGENGKAKN